MLEMNKYKDFLHFLRRRLAKIWLEINLQLTVVGVTGSYGKTTAVYAIAQVLSSKYSVNRTDLNLDTVYNLPITILKTKIWNEILVLEYGVDRQGEMDRHLSLVKPSIAVLTGITPVHSDKEHLGSLENIIREKRKLIEAIPKDGLAIFNYDDEIVRKIGQEFLGQKIFYGTKKEADIWADNIKIALSGTEFNLHDGNEEIKIKTGLIGYPAVYACLVAWIVGKELKIDQVVILTSLKRVKPLPGRLSVEPGPLGTILINDARRANPASTIAGLRTLSEFPGRKVAVLGEMGELGKLGEKMHREVGSQAAKLKIDLLVGVGPLTKFIIEEAAKNRKESDELFWTKNVFEAEEILRKILRQGDLLYLKASLLRHLERIILLLEGKKVKCKKTVCHHYQPCANCPKLSLKISHLFI